MFKNWYKIGRGKRFYYIIKISEIELGYRFCLRIDVKMKGLRLNLKMIKKEEVKGFILDLMWKRNGYSEL